MSQLKGPVSYLSLWYNPGRFLQGLIQNGEGQLGAIVIATSFGVVQSFAHFRVVEDPSPNILIAGAVLGLVLLYLIAWLMRNFGRWFGAQAKISELRLAFGWGLFPWLIAFSLLGWLSERVVNPADIEGVYPYFFAFFVYGYIILLLCIRSALGISFLKSFLCLIVTTLVSLFPLTLIAQILLGDSPTQ